MSNFPPAFRSLAVSGLLVCLVALTGCSGSDLPADAGAVEGTVTYEGQKVDGAIVIFRSEDGFSAVGKTNAEGLYKLSSTQIPGGAKVGSYTITVDKRAATTGVSLTEDDPNYRPNQQQSSQAAKRLLPEKYARPQTTDLKAEVVAGNNVVDLDLTK
ncbi:carboxypeptidase-like regulatory domain-containing protein [Blastopirellula retiformator]|uniref:Carboxypeptidase regulatory-like domain-containing protein n=1 Tax=Blastopirellula retiformator TaxID=2527970 RepID=A0A5C5V6L7_9BACT|nr:carboxypeptidase-like regulatory domain-containing protein [Blastopirellula retiformator]TWT34234.1 hypothetical protein Enr8_16280 [Blastopirellula retiformator]